MSSWKQIGLLSSFIFLVPLSAECESPCIERDICEPDPCAEQNRNSFKIRGAAFFPQGSLTKRIYGKVWPEGSLEYNYKWGCCFSLFVNGAVTGKKGHSIGLGNSTRIVLVPLTIGINARFGSSWVHPYLGIGVGGAYAHIHNHSSFVKRNTNHWGFASLFQVGVELDCNSWFFIDLFGDYRWNRFHFNKQSSRQTGGFDVGAGLGFRI